MRSKSRIDPTLILELFEADTSEFLKLPLFESDLPAGYPTPADSHVKLKLDLNQHLIEHPAATFYAKVRGRSREDIGVDDGDILVVDRAVELRENDLVVCKFDKGYTIKRVHLEKYPPSVLHSNNESIDLYLDDHEEMKFCGVVTFIIHKP